MPNSVIAISLGDEGARFHIAVLAGVWMIERGVAGVGRSSQAVTAALVMPPTESERR